jgi:hypothetical protein
MKMNDCANCHAKEESLIVDTEIQGSLGRQLREMASVVFPNATTSDMGSSVQTGKDACFVCHK